MKNIINIIPKIRMLMMEDDNKGILRLSEGGAGDADISSGGLGELIDKLKTASRKPSSVYMDGVGLLRFIKKPGGGRLDQKISIVTGSAQGFGRGIAEEMAKNGAYVVIADINRDLAESVSGDLNARYGEGSALAVRVDVSDEDSVRDMFAETVAYYGGLDIFVSNAGILRAGALDEMSLQTFETVTRINYSAYFLCVKYASEVMKAQHEINGNYFMDVIQINSKSGLEGSEKNFAYAGGKFGGIGLTQSFAKELIPYKIKVNSICPGNFFGGPLWSDPENGLFVQYLNVGKVAGAKTIADVKRYYESRVPMNRGCEVIDVARALLYLVEQEYETGQALPVTGGQVMLK